MKSNYWLRSGTYTMAQRVSAFLFGFGSYFFLVRYFDIASFGVWSLYVVIAASLEMARSAFVQNAFVKFFNDDKYDKSRLFWSSLVLNAGITLVIVLVLLVSVPLMVIFWQTEAIAEIVYWYCGTSIVLVPFTQFNYLEQANHRFKGVFWSAVARQGLFFVIVVIVFAFIPGLPMRFFAMMHVFCAIVGLLVSYIMISDSIPKPFVWDWSLIRALFKFGKYILGTGFFSALGKNADQIILGSINHSFVALYNAGIRILQFVEIPTFSISNIVYPKVAQLAVEKGPNGVGEMYQKSVATILAFVLPVILVVLIFPETILLITAGAKYVSAAPVLRLVMAAAILIPFNVQMGTSFEVMGRPQTGFYINLSANVINVICNIFLIRAYGVIGAAVASVITVLLVFVSSQFFLRKMMKISLIAVFYELIATYKKGFDYVTGLLSKPTH